MMKKLLRVLLAACIIISFCIFLTATDIGESVRLIKQMGYKVVFIFLSTFFAYLFGALGWKYCIDSDSTPSLPRLFMLRHIGNVITIFNPAGAIAGELYNADMLIQGGMVKSIAYKSVLLSRVMMILTQLLLLLIVLVWFLYSLSEKFQTGIRYTLYACFVSFFLIVALLIWLLLKKGRETYTAKAEKKWHRLIHRLREIRSSLAEYIQRRPKAAGFSFLFFTAHWVLGSLELYFILCFLGYEVTIWDGLFLDTVIIVSKSAVTFIPGQFGAEELINKFVLQLIRINSAYLWLSVSILRRARQLFWCGIAFLFYIGLKKNNRINSSGSIVRES